MNNKFIPILSVFMTISLLVFVSLQLYWLRDYYAALEQDFSNKVHGALEESAKKVSDLEIDKYLNTDYKNFGENVVSTSKQPTQTYIQQITDSATRKSIIFSKKIIENQNIPISRRGDSLMLTKMYTDEGLINIKKKNNTPEPLTSEINNNINNFDREI